MQHFLKAMRYRMSINNPFLAVPQVVKFPSISMHSFSSQPALWGAVMKMAENLLFFFKGAVFLYSLALKNIICISMQWSCCLGFLKWQNMLICGLKLIPAKVVTD